MLSPRIKQDNDWTAKDFIAQLLFFSFSDQIQVSKLKEDFPCREEKVHYFANFRYIKWLIVPDFFSLDFINHIEASGVASREGNVQ